QTDGGGPPPCLTPPAGVFPVKTDVKGEEAAEAPLRAGPSAPAPRRGKTAPAFRSGQEPATTGASTSTRPHGQAETHQAGGHRHRGPPQRAVPRRARERPHHPRPALGQDEEVLHQDPPRRPRRRRALALRPHEGTDRLPLQVVCRYK